jgi:predicted nucleic acid-binding Zn ribbon protein
MGEKIKVIKPHSNCKLVSFDLSPGDRVISTACGASFVPKEKAERYYNIPESELQRFVKLPNVEQARDTTIGIMVFIYTYK